MHEKIFDAKISSFFFVLFVFRSGDAEAPKRDLRAKRPSLQLPLFAYIISKFSNHFLVFFQKNFFSEVFIALIEAVKVRNPARFCQNFPMKRNLLIFMSKRSKEISCIEKLMQIF